MAATMDSVARRIPGFSFELECEAVAQVLPTSNDTANDRPLAFARDQRIDKVNLVHSDKLQDFSAHLPSGIARQGIDHLQAFGRSESLAGIGHNFAQRPLGERGVGFDERIEPGTCTPIGECDHRCITDLWMRFQSGDDQRRILG